MDLKEVSCILLTSMGILGLLLLTACGLRKQVIRFRQITTCAVQIKSREIGLESFKDICDSTSQKKWTNYSNIQNLNTGDIWLYYAMNYSRPYKTNIKELFKKGNRSFYMYELFKDDPLVKEILQSKETENQFFLFILASLFVILLLTIYILAIKRRQRKLRKIQNKQ